MRKNRAQVLLTHSHLRAVGYHIMLFVLGSNCQSTAINTTHKIRTSFISFSQLSSKLSRQTHRRLTSESGSWHSLSDREILFFLMVYSLRVRIIMVSTFIRPKLIHSHSFPRQKCKVCFYCHCSLLWHLAESNGLFCFFFFKYSFVIYTSSQNAVQSDFPFLESIFKSFYLLLQCSWVVICLLANVCNQGVPTLIKLIF